MNIIRTVVLGVVEAAFPQRCCLCGVDPADAPFPGRGDLVRGLRWWDRPHLCRVCGAMLGDTGPVVRPAGENVPRIWAAGVTGSDLVRTVGNLKYHGVRGLAWPLAIHMAHALPPVMPSCRLVPVPLHRRRRRIRGFNQAELLARLVGRIRTMEVTDRRLVRRRATRQQARLTDDEQRRANLADAFSWRGPEPTHPVVIVDDIVTSGATVRAAAGAIRRAGGQVLGVLALGLAAGDR